MAVHFDISELDKFTRRISNTKAFKKRVENAFYNSLNVISIRAKKVHKWKNRTGLLQGSIFQEVSGLVGSVFVPTDRVPYAEWIYNGSGIFGKHKTEIVPRQAKALSFRIGGNQFFATSVKGVKGEPWIENAYDDKKNQFFREFQDELVEEFNEDF